MVFTGFILLCAGAAIIFNGVKIFQEFSEIRKWPQISAKIIKVSLTGNRAIQPEIDYLYRIDLVEYNGVSDLGIPPFGNRNKRILTSRSVISKFQIGDSISIRYNPYDNSESTTQFNPPWHAYVKSMSGVLIISAGIFIIFLRII